MLLIVSVGKLVKKNQFLSNLEWLLINLDVINIYHFNTKCNINEDYAGSKTRPTRKS